MELPVNAWTTVYCSRPYNPYKLNGRPNPAFDRVLDGRLLDFKEGLYHAVRAETPVFRSALSALDLPAHTVMAIVPGHVARPTNMDHPLTWVGEELVQRDARLILAADTLRRVATIPRLASGGERSIDKHMTSLDVSDGRSRSARRHGRAA